MSFVRTLACTSSAFCLVAATSGVLVAQQSPPWTAVDSANAARRHYSKARDAARTGSLQEAQHMLAEATRAFPSQPAYTVSLASVAARNGDGAVVAAALTQLARLEAGWELATDSTVLSLTARDTSVASAHQRLLRALAPVAAGTLLRALHDSTLFPEGIALNTRTGSLFVTSIRHRTIVEVTSKGTERDVIPRHQESIGAILAVRVDTDGEHLWATTAGLPMMHGFTDADSAIAALLRIRIADGAVVGRWDLGKGERHVPGDVAIAPNGDVFISDSQVPVLFRLRAGTSTLESVTHPSFRSLQGIAISDDGRHLYVADYSHGLLRMRLDNGDIELVKQPADMGTLGLDGIVLHGSTLIGIQNGASPARVVQYTLDTTGLAITSSRTLDRQPALVDEPTNGVVVGNDFVYIANSQWEKYGPDGKRIGTSALQAARLMRVRLEPPRRPLW